MLQFIPTMPSTESINHSLNGYTDKINRAIPSLASRLSFASLEQVISGSSPEEVFQNLTIFLCQMREQGPALDIQMALGASPDREFLPLLYSGMLLNNQVCRLVQVTQVPAGDAPVEYRQAWVGTTFAAILIDQLELDGSFTGFSLAAGLPIDSSEQSRLVYAPYAISKLQASHPQAANWFTQAIEKNSVDMLSFQPNEITLLDWPNSNTL